MTAREIAPEVDRLVWSVGRTVPDRHGERIRGLAAELGLESLFLMAPFAEFLVAGGIAREIAMQRVLYFDVQRIHDRFDELIANGFVAEDPLLRGTDRLVPLLSMLLEARAETAAAAWAEDIEAVQASLPLVRRAIAAADGSHIVAARHRELPDPDGAAAALVHSLITLRYIRQHDHAEAWRERRLTPADMAVLTPLWTGSAPAPDHDESAVSRLVERGWVEAEATALTPLGRSEREAIERATNEKNQHVYSALGPEARDLFDALQSLPDADLVLV